MSVQRQKPRNSGPLAWRLRSSGLLCRSTAWRRCAWLTSSAWSRSRPHGTWGSRGQTFGRILAAARRVASQALVGGLGLRIEATASVEIKRIASDAAVGVPALRRVAVSAHAASLEAAVAPRFGRAPGFLIVDPKTMDFEYVANGVSADPTNRHGVDAAALIANAGVAVLLTGFVGERRRPWPRREFESPTDSGR